MRYHRTSGWKTSGGILAALIACASVASPCLAEEPAAPAAKEPATPPALKYGWKEGEQYRYFFSIEATAFDKQANYSGISAYTAKRRATAGEQSTSSSGSAFVIAADGHLLTCHHVITGASKIEVVLGDKTYAGNVVASDAGLDVALLKIEATGLSPLALADSKKVELGQEIRSVGYPLLELLGESVKMNRGAVAGFVRLAGQNFLQVDVSINPGNSGGPVVDDGGNVVGIASQKLYGSRISNVGFCVPSNEIGDWLASKTALRVERSNARQPLSGPDLAKKVTPNVALLKVTASHDLWELHSRSYMSGGYSSQADQGRVTVNEFGEVVDDKDGASLPLMLGPIVTLTVDPVDPDSRQEWKSERHVFIVRQKELPRNSLFDPIYPGQSGGRFSAFGFGERPKTTAEFLVATETSEYKVTEVSEATVKLSKKLRLATEERSTNGVDLSIAGNLVYDRARGVMQSASLEGRYVLATENVTIRIPLKVSYRPFTNEEEGRTSSAARRPVEPPAKPDPLVQAELEKLGKALEREPVLQALQALLTMKRDKPSRAAVVEKAASLLVSDDREIRVQALKTLAYWDWSTKLRDVLPLLKNEDGQTRKAAIFYLGEMQDADAAPALCEHLLRMDERDLAITALKNIGAAAESAVLDLLKHEDSAIRIAGCQILAEIGSADVVALLRRLALSKDAAATASQEALTKLGYSVAPARTKKAKPADDDENPFDASAKRKAKPADDDENPFEQPKPKK